MPDLGWQELLIILVIVIIIFGAGKLPEISGAMGKSIKEFKKASADDAPSLPKQTASGGTPTETSADRAVRAEDI
jgi:sec-independent protein translocase protein TatA